MFYILACPIPISNVSLVAAQKQVLYLIAIYAGYIADVSVFVCQYLWQQDTLAALILLALWYFLALLTYIQVYKFYSQGKWLTPVQSILHQAFVCISNSGSCALTLPSIFMDMLNQLLLTLLRYSWGQDSNSRQTFSSSTYECSISISFSNISSTSQSISSNM